ncbi:MAG: sterile alpha motif-like domain-containing protein [gamma proteobacterium symbiont of Taylorina sp.]|nr:sterile alpha motif-like domain-containing protein [gamma proteobacterium symbiont of Taylorina sp.]
MNNFYTWLKELKDEDSPIGDLSNDMMRYDSSVNINNDRESWHSHLSIKGACSEAHDALDEAWDEYSVSH